MQSVRLARLEDLVVGVLERVFQFELLAVRLDARLLLVLVADLGPREVEADREQDEDEAEDEDEARRRPAELVALPRRGRDEVLGRLGAVGAPPGRVHGGVADADVRGGHLSICRQANSVFSRLVELPCVLQLRRLFVHQSVDGGLVRVLDECDHRVRLVLRTDLDRILDEDVARREAAPQ